MTPVCFSFLCLLHSDTQKCTWHTLFCSERHDMNSDLLIVLSRAQVGLPLCVILWSKHTFYAEVVYEDAVHVFICLAFLTFWNVCNALGVDGLLFKPVCLFMICYVWSGGLIPPLSCPAPLPVSLVLQFPVPSDKLHACPHDWKRTFSAITGSFFVFGVEDFCHCVCVSAAETPTMSRGMQAMCCRPARIAQTESRFSSQRTAISPHVSCLTLRVCLCPRTNCT